MIAPDRCSCHLLEPIDLRQPFWTYAQSFRDSPYSFLLDSGMDPGKLGRFSFLGADPVLVVRAYRDRGARSAAVELFAPQSPQPLIVQRHADAFAELQKLLDAWKVDLPKEPAPFLGGAVGYFGYESGYLIEDLPDVARDDLRLPTIYFGFYDVVLAHCHASNQSYLSVIGRGGSDAAARRDAASKRDAMLKRLHSAKRAAPAARPGAADSPTSPFDEASYGRLVEQAREHIAAGDVFEICLTHRLECGFTGDPWRLYRELRRINPAPFAAFLKFPEAQVVCSSPERFVRLGRDRIAESRPIKGTRRRGKSSAEDERLRNELQQSPKDRAENIMIVDLVRNDFGRVCKFRTVTVPELMIVEKYATVFQLVSTIRGELRDGVAPLELVKACFPGGSMTGAPKIQALKIIDQLEPVKRGIYSGSIGYLDYGGAMDLNIVIRTLIVKDGRCYLNVGGAVVADSDPRDEYEETMVKAAALTECLRLATAHET